MGGFLILCNPVSVKLESPDSVNGHKKMYWFLLVDHASPLAFPRDTTFLQQKQKTLPQPTTKTTVLPNLGAFISSNIPPEHHEWLHQNVLGALAETYIYIYIANWKSKKDIIYRKRQQTVGFLSNSKFGGTNLKPKKTSLPKVKILKVVTPPLESWFGGTLPTPLNLICFKASGWSKSILGRLIYKRRHEYL